MADVIKIDESTYPVEELFNDILKDIEHIKDVLIVVTNKDGTAELCHTGMPIQELAVATKLIDKEIFNSIEDENTEEEDK